MEGLSKFKNGHWIWNEHYGGVQFISHEIIVRQDVPTAKLKKQPVILASSIHFRETVDTVEKINFRRTLQRHVPASEADFVTVQDVKDVALFLADPRDLSVELIAYFHLPEMDNFLKNTIVYIQYYLQIWEGMMLRRVEARRKLRQPVVNELEDVVRDDLSDLRSMLAREYSIVLLGIGTVKPYHHLSDSNISLAERDKRLFEAFLCMTIRIVWIALQRRNFNVIEMELNRVFRTDHFNVVCHRSNKLLKSVWRSSEEERVLAGATDVKESKLNDKSGLVKELLLGKHDSRMLGAGFKEFQPMSERAIYLERLFAAPVELLYEYGITIGLIGIPREEYDSMLYPRRRTAENFDQILIEPIHFKFPVFEDIPDKDMPKEFPRAPSIFTESSRTKESRITQSRIWKNYLLTHQRQASSNYKIV